MPAKDSFHSADSAAWMFENSIWHCLSVFWSDWMADIVCAFISVQRCIFSRCKDILALCQVLTVKLNLWPVGKTLLYLW